MTGFGRAVVENAGIELEIEIRSVNHRFLDFSLKLPQGYNVFELELGKILKNSIRRGRIEVSIIRKDRRTVNQSPQCNTDLLKSLLSVVRSASQDLGLDADLVTNSVAINAMGRREFIDFSALEEQNVAEEFSLLEDGFKQALNDLVKMRVCEGEALRLDLLSHLANLRELVRHMVEASKKTVPAYRERLTQRLQKLEGIAQVDPERLAQEVALLADKTDFSEEVARLNSHCSQFKEIVSSGAGRKLDFLVQEMMREVNTIGSKAQNSNVSVHVVEAKTVIEKIREQVQNVE